MTCLPYSVKFKPNEAWDLYDLYGDTAGKFAVRTSARRASDENISENMTGVDDTYHLQTMTLGRDKKKKSKIKKFFQKLSSKKDGKDEFMQDIYDHSRLPSSTDSDYRTSVSSYVGNIRQRYPSDGRRKSDGTISLHSIHDNYILNPTPTSKRRMFLFNLSFLKKGRKRSNTCCNDISSRQHSDTIRALCSPDMDRRHRITHQVHQRRGSDPSLYRIAKPLLQAETKKYRAPLPPAHIPPYATVKFRTRVSNSSVSSVEDEAEYINYPFSKTNVLPPRKPQRSRSKGSSSEPFQDNRSNSISSSSSGSKKSDQDWQKDVEIAVEHLNKSNRLSSNSSDSSPALSSESLSSNTQRHHMFSSELSYGTPASRTSSNTSSSRTSSVLRKTPLRHSIDSFNKLIEVHRQTIDKIAYESSRLTCNCETLHHLDWEDFESKDESIQLGLTSYMVVPVTCSNDNEMKRNYTAWLRLEQKQTSQQISDFPRINYPKATLHRNCLHVCHTIEQAYSEPVYDGMPKSIQINHVYISTQVPNMTLSKYITLTLEKHARYPEVYERETALILLQVVKGIQYFHNNGILINSIDAENIFILNNGEPSVVLSPRRTPNKAPSVAVAVLPGLGNSFDTSEYDHTTNICHQLAFLLFELLHSPYHDELKDAVDMSMLLATLPDLTIKSIYSRYLQYVINILLGSTTHDNKSLDSLRLLLEVVLFGPTDICDHSEDDAIILINKWHNRRCVDMVTHILKEASLIMLGASSGAGGQDVEKLKSVDQELLMECEFLANVTPTDIYRISKMLNR